MASNVQKVLELIDALTPDEKRLIYKKMNDEINGKLLDFLDTVNERAEKFPISMDEIQKRLRKSGAATMEKDKVVVDTNIFVSAFLGSKMLS